MFTDRECDAIDAHRDLCKERDLFPLDEPSAVCEDCGSHRHTSCTPPPAHPCDGGTLRDGHWTDCAFEAGHVGRCSGAKEQS